MKFTLETALTRTQILLYNEDVWNGLLSASWRNDNQGQLCRLLV